MSSNNHKNKCRNGVIGELNAPWFTIRVARGRRRNKLAYKSLRKNRMKK